MRADRPDLEPSISAEEYLSELKELLGRVPPLPAAEVPITQAQGRVLAQDVASLVDIPGFANSAMDGYAVRGEDLLDKSTVALKIVGEQPAGLSRGLEIGAQEAIRIMTGAPVPLGADTVVQSELTVEEDDCVTIEAGVQRGGNVRYAGEDTSRGERVLERGTSLGARQLSAAGAAGHDRLWVYRPLRVGVVSTGDELAAPGEQLKPGQIYESNSILLAGLATALNAEAKVVKAVDDGGAGLIWAMDELASEVDIILLSGGVSVGRFDVVRNVLSKRADARLTRVAIQPGKPQAYALWGDTPVLGFPGNPVGAYVSFMVFGVPFLRARAGQEFFWAKPYAAQSGDSWACPAGRRQFVPVTIEPSESSLPVVRPLVQGGSRSHLVTTLAQAEALAIVGEGVDRVEVGDDVQVMEIL